jgi:hypothetical protein
MDGSAYQVYTSLQRVSQESLIYQFYWFSYMRDFEAVQKLERFWCVDKTFKLQFDGQKIKTTLGVDGKMVGVIREKLLELCINHPEYRKEDEQKSWILQHYGNK